MEPRLGEPSQKFRRYVLYRGDCGKRRVCNCQRRSVIKYGEKGAEKVGEVHAGDTVWKVLQQSREGYVVVALSALKRRNGYFWLTNFDHFTAQRRIFQLAARGYSSAGVFLRYFTAGIHYCQLRRSETRCTVYARRFSARIRGCTKRGGVPAAPSRGQPSPSKERG